MMILAMYFAGWKQASLIFQKSILSIFMLFSPLKMELIELPECSLQMNADTRILRLVPMMKVEWN
ncbi:hypothetical protein D515_04523 [Grimontia indica]|uniref:Uncharacterized protein n=1 Tax=Grimontia indica TaxID=1056512 RepID=R1GLX4_9GAMM|nr:hypothetical protein D515_04523 [Grimontia indica]